MHTYKVLVEIHPRAAALQIRPSSFCRPHQLWKASDLVVMATSECCVSNIACDISHNASLHLKDRSVDRSSLCCFVTKQPLYFRSPHLPRPPPPFPRQHPAIDSQSTFAGLVQVSLLVAHQQAIRLPPIVKTQGAQANNGGSLLRQTLVSFPGERCIFSDGE